jgi:YfiH family protein
VNVESNSLRDGEALVPEGWPDIEGLVAGFGHRLAAAPAGSLLLERQVHGVRVVEAPCDLARLPRDREDGLPRLPEEADALVSVHPGVVVGVRTADCVPLLMVAPARGWSAAVHAGWRGTFDGIAGEAVKAAARSNVAPGEIFVALGPSIGPCCYEVSEELGEQFAGAGFDVRSREGGSWSGQGRTPGKPHLDLRAANRLLLERCGVTAANVQEVGPCTRCARDRFHSFRADPGSAGRQVSWVGWAAGAARRPFPGP